FSICSARLRWARSVRALALARCTSRFLRQLTYSFEPAATLLARQNASSSALVSTMVGWPRSRQPVSKGAASRSAMKCFADPNFIGGLPFFHLVIAGDDPAIHRKDG